MNPEAEKLRHAMSVVEIKWLQDNADTVAELVDAAMDVQNKLQEPGDAAALTVALRRLDEAVTTFKGPQEPPEPKVNYKETLTCPEPDCPWERIATRRWSPRDAYAIHYRETHQGGKP